MWASGSALRVAFCASVLALSSSCADVIGDEVCPPGSDPNDRNDECPYGPPGGPKVSQTDLCAPIPQTKTNCTTTWLDIYPMLTTNASDPNAACSNAGCHGNAPGQGGIFLKEGDAVQAYTALKAYTGTQSTPYLSDVDPANTWILCNLQAQAGGGVGMPPSGLDQTTLAAVVQWAKCGEVLQP